MTDCTATAAVVIMGALTVWRGRDRAAQGARTEMMSRGHVTGLSSPQNPPRFAPDGDDGSDLVLVLSDLFALVAFTAFIHIHSLFSLLPNQQILYSPIEGGPLLPSDASILPSSTSLGPSRTPPYPPH
jgi:hypothetical protein